ncbi:acyl-CoA thioester hydrolase/BAAT C-terminal domain-containing protein [Rhodopila sp.]|uniref:acyl-CoA thioester hydrolase/BAAT C-terminal domain-containing protein n=1 Tax=Rhodopila sp. TaxID=2480087 RepID=UPI003D10936F
MISYRSLHEQSLLRFASEVSAATIAVECTKAEIILVAGGDDAIWPSDTFAKSIAARLASYAKHASLVFNQEAGHRVLFPGEKTPRSALHAHGGNDRADAALGEAAWKVMTECLDLPP